MTCNHESAQAIYFTDLGAINGTHYMCLECNMMYVGVGFNSLDVSQFTDNILPFSYYMSFCIHPSEVINAGRS